MKVTAGSICSRFHFETASFPNVLHLVWLEGFPNVTAGCTQFENRLCLL